MNRDLVEVPFHGDVIEAAQDDRGVWVPLRRPCENLGLEFSAQRSKLVKKAWANVSMIDMQVGGQAREMFCLHLDCLPMWLATIEASRVREEVRPKLEVYQREAAKALADWFFGRKQQPPTPDAGLIAGLAAAVVKELVNHFPGARPADDWITVENRCRQRWPQAESKDRRRVRDVAMGIYRERLGRWPCKLTGHLNGVIAFEREHLDILDQAIDIVMEEATGSQVAPLFMRPSDN